MRNSNMVNEKVLRKYAELAVKMGVNVQKGQMLVITSDVKNHEFVNLCVEEGYKAGASQVTINTPINIFILSPLSFV